MSMVNDLAKSHVRTVVPFVVGMVISLLLRAGIDVHGYAPEISVAVGYLYYALVRLAERNWSPKFGWLLGAIGAPKYRPAKKA